MGSSLFKWVTPNRLTLVRIGAIPVILVLIYRGEGVTNWISLAVYSIACITDFLDGKLARFRDEVSPLGKLLDPIADKMLISACLVMQVFVGVADVVPTILILLREFAISGMRQVAAVEGIVVAAGSGAKYKTTLQMLAVGFLLIRQESFSFPSVEIGRVLLWAAMVLTLWTGFGYFRDYFRKA
jgi:CDP-diacylglycerol--glycerol-3-phosphate 3-phosphatidyltransferase